MRVLSVQAETTVKGRGSRVLNDEGSQDGHQLDNWILESQAVGFKLGRTSRVSLPFPEEEPEAWGDEAVCRPPWHHLLYLLGAHGAWQRLQ